MSTIVNPFRQAAFSPQEINKSIENASSWSPNRLDRCWSEPLRVDNELSNINSWREIHEKDEAALRPSIQDISSSRT